MDNKYPGVITRFLHPDERLILSEDVNELPLVIEAKDRRDAPFLQSFLKSHSAALLEDIATYGAVLFRGFDINTDEQFEKTVLTIQGFQGISDAFMSEEGRVHVGPLNYVLHTNAVYKTGGTLYLGGFHSENYYSPDVPSYICFCCIEPSTLGGETGLVNSEKIYQNLSDALKKKLEKNTFFVSKWLVSDVAKRYKLSPEAIEKICKHVDLPIVGEGNDQFILMYKPSVLIHPQTKKNALQINLFEIAGLNEAMRISFMKDYQGKKWFWHRFVWKLPAFILSILEFFYIMFASFFYSPKDSINILLSKCHVFKASHKKNRPVFNSERVGSCFNEKEVDELARLIRQFYSSCLWKKGDILIIDNRKVMHAGMPGGGPRVVRAMIGNPMEMNYSFKEPGSFDGKERNMETIGFHMAHSEGTK